jgi:DNA-binding transcriptional MerR regulator
MKIGELAQQMGLNPRTIRFYESIGVLPEPPRTASGYREYDRSDLDRLGFIKSAQSLGLSLDDIGEILALKDRGEAPCPYVREVIDRQAAEVEERIEELQRLRIELRRLRRVARALPDQIGGDACVCHIIENEARAGARRP